MGRQFNVNDVDRMIKLLKELDAYKGHLFSPFQLSDGEINELQSKVTEMLEDYKMGLKIDALADYYINYHNKNNRGKVRGEASPAYKADIDNKLIYKLFEDGKSLNEIARQANCSPDTVKRRLCMVIFNMKE